MLEKPKILNDEEIRVANQIPPEEYGSEPDWWLRMTRKVAQAQLDADVRWFVDWLRDNDMAQYYSPEAGCEIIAISLEGYQALQTQVEEVLKC